MSPAVISAPIAQARIKCDQYSAFLSKRKVKDPELVAAERIYYHLALGKKLIDVGRAIREGGFDDHMRPRLALARADRRQVHFRWEPQNDFATLNSNLDTTSWKKQHPQFVEQVNFNRRHGVTYETSDGRRYGKQIDAFALVPMVPPEHRPKAPLSQFHILWEVEQWADQRIGAKPPVDPYLLQRISGDVFEVLAEWDLTDVERMVMEGRARVTS